jgi:glycosyltransferase involved in cell wall biosynthesis
MSTPHPDGAGERSPILSVTVPTRGRPDLLERALASVVRQSDAPTERIELLVSDNSPDVNEVVANAELERWPGPRCYLPNRPDIGAIPNFNQCIERAQGRFLLLLHDDDYLLPGSLATIVEALDTATQSDESFLFGALVVDIEERVRRRQVFRVEHRLTPAAAMRRLLTDSSFVRIPAIVIRRDVLLAVGGFDPNVRNPTDFDLLIRVFARQGVRVMPGITAAYTVHALAATSAMFHEGTIRTLADLFDRAVRTGVLPEATVRRCEVEWFHQFILGGTYRLLRIGDTVQARQVFALFGSPEVRRMGRSRRWFPVRVLFRMLLALPSGIAGPVMRVVGRFSPERLWMPP